MNPSAGRAVGSTPSAPKSGQVHFNSVIYLGEDGSNYNSWKLHIQWILWNRHIWGLINGSIPRPDANINAATHAKWVEKDKEAFCHILMSLKDKSTHYVKKATSSKEAWDGLLSPLPPPCPTITHPQSQNYVKFSKPPPKAALP